MPGFEARLFYSNLKRKPAKTSETAAKVASIHTLGKTKPTPKPLVTSFMNTFVAQYWGVNLASHHAPPVIFVTIDMRTASVLA